MADDTSNPMSGHDARRAGRTPDYDLSFCLKVARDCDFEAVERVRRFVCRDPELLAGLAAGYWKFDTWMQRSLVIQMVQDARDPVLRPIMHDILRAKASSGDEHMQLTKAAAVCFLEGDFDLFMTFFDDRALLREHVERHLRTRGDVLTDAP